MYPPPRKWGRGTTLRSRVVEGARAATKLFRRKRRVESDAPSTTLPPTRSALRRTQTLRSSQSERRRVAGADKRSRSRDAVSVRTRVMRQATANNFAAIPIFVRSPRRWIGRMHHDRARRTKERTEIKKEAERRKAQGQPPHLQGAARVQRDAHAFRRSTAALAKGTIHPQGSAQAMLPETWPERPVLYGRPNRGAETLRFSTGITRAAPVPVQRSTSRAGPSAGRMMPKPPECDSDEPPPAGTALAPPAAVTRPASLIRARLVTCSGNRDYCQGNIPTPPAWERIYIFDNGREFGRPPALYRRLPRP